MATQGSRGGFHTEDGLLGGLEAKANGLVVALASLTGRLFGDLLEPVSSSRRHDEKPQTFKGGRGGSEPGLPLVHAHLLLVRLLGLPLPGKGRVSVGPQ